MRFKFFEEELNNKFPSKKGLIVFGQGSGHGVGMSQWGAKYLASRGQKAERILKYFYILYMYLTVNKSKMINKHNIVANVFLEIIFENNFLSSLHFS